MTGERRNASSAGLLGRDLLWGALAGGAVGAVWWLGVLGYVARATAGSQLAGVVLVVVAFLLAAGVSRRSRR